MKYSYVSVKEGGWLSNISHSTNQVDGKGKIYSTVLGEHPAILHSHKFSSTVFQIQYLLMSRWEIVENLAFF